MHQKLKDMRKAIFVIAILFSLNVFSQEERIMKILEPYTNFSFLGKSDKVLGADLPSWGMEWELVSDILQSILR